MGQPITITLLCCKPHLHMVTVEVEEIGKRCLPELGLGAITPGIMQCKEMMKSKNVKSVMHVKVIH